MADQINHSTQKVNQMTSEHTDITLAGLCKNYFEADKDGRRFIRTFAIASVLKEAESLSDANTRMDNSLAQVRKLVQAHLDRVPERERSCEYDTKVLTDTLSVFTHGFRKHIETEFSDAPHTVADLEEWPGQNVKE